MPGVVEPSARHSTVAFLLGDPKISGGTNVILEHALAMQAAGHSVTLVTPRPVLAGELAWKPGADTLARATAAGLRRRSLDLAVATWWRSAFDLAELDAGACAYFVQSIESRFFAGEHPRWQALARASYHLPLPVITEAGWIADYLRTHLGRDVRVVRNGIDKQTFTPDGPRLAPPLGHGLRVLVEGPLGVPFKRVELAVRLAQRAGVREVWLLTATPCASYRGVHRTLSRVPPQRVGDVLRACDVLLKLSTVEGMFGPPLEMMHCGGTAITSDVTGHDEYVRHGDNGLVVPRGEELAAVAHLCDLTADRDRLEALRAGALATARTWPSWAEAAQGMRAALEGVIASGAAPSSAQLRDAVAHAAPLAVHGNGTFARLRRHLRAFTRTRLPALAASIDRGERSARSRHVVTALPTVALPNFAHPGRRLRVLLLGDRDPFADHWPGSGAEFEVVRRTPTDPAVEADLALVHDRASGQRLLSLQDGPLTLLVLTARTSACPLPLPAHGILVTDLIDGIELRRRGLPVASTWLPTVPETFLLADSSPSAWRARRRAVLHLDDHRTDADSLPLSTPAASLATALADSRVVTLPRRPRDARLAAARAMLAMASGCLVVSPPLALDYGALLGEHYLPADAARSPAVIDSADAEVVRRCGRDLAARHAATPRLVRLIAELTEADRTLGARIIRGRHSP